MRRNVTSLDQGNFRLFRFCFSIHSRLFKLRSRTNLKLHPFEYFRCITPDGMLVHHRVTHPPSPLITGLPQRFVEIPRLYPSTHGGGKRHCVSPVSCLGTQHTSSPGLSTRSLTHKDRNGRA